MELQPETVLTELSKWHLRYPSKDRQEQQIPFLASEYYEDLVDDFSEEAFNAAVRLVRKRSKFFPTVGHIFDVRDEAIALINRERQNRVELLPEKSSVDLTPEEIERNEERMRIVRSAINNEISFKDAEEMLSKMIGFAATK